MIIYNYNAITKEYTGSESAQPNPLEPGKYLIPANATEMIPPETSKNEIASFEGDNWVKKPDFRGQKQVNLVTKEVTDINYIGAIAEGFELVSDEIAEDITLNPQKYSVEKNRLSDISNTPEFKKAQAEARQAEWENQFAQTDLGWLRITTAAGDLLSLLNSYEIIARIQGGIPAQSLLFYSTPDFNRELTEDYVISLQKWNTELTYEGFTGLFNQVAQVYLERFRGN